MLIRRIVSLAVALLAATAITAASQHFTPRRGHRPRPGRPRLFPGPNWRP